jgi:phospholipid/cholesterol/gamma-HCH transport system ATP-binding protein
MIQVDQLGKQFQDRWIFRNLSLQVKLFESVVLIGPSGGGKSVLLKTIAGLLHANEGKIRLGTQNIGMLFQKNALFDSFTVQENLLFPLREKKGITGQKAKDRVASLLKAVDLNGCEDLYPDEISGGMQKRLGIARALVVEPEIMLYDEPTAGLDPITSKTIADLIRNLRKEVGCTLLTVTNDMQRAYQIADRIFLLAQGQLISGETPENIRMTNHPSVRQFIYGLKTGPLTSGLA